MHKPTLRRWLQAIGNTQSSFAAIGRAVLALALGLVFMLGCQKSPTIADNSAIVVQPGVGIANVCEIGMDFSQIRMATGDATTQGIYDGSLSWRRLASHGRGRFMLVPSLGAIAAIGIDESISLVEFYVRPHKEKIVSGLEVSTPFRGSLGKLLSFKDSVVSNRQVETIFGSVTQVATNAAEALVFRRNSQAFVHRRGDGVEEIWYPTRGVAFVFETNVVTSFQIYKPTGTNR